MTNATELSPREWAEREYKPLTNRRLTAKINHLKRTLRRGLSASTAERIAVYLAVAVEEAQRRVR